MSVSERGSSNDKGLFALVRSEIDFPRDEAQTLAFWKERGVFHKTLSAETRATGPSQGTFVFYEGPPTANGMPHNGHVLTRSVKDVFPRYKTMCGYDVPRKAGWDTHGLPVEVEVEKELGIHGKADIEAYGIRPFISRCIDSVFRYTDAWERLTDKVGFWVDLDTAYVTYHKSYVESVWWALSELHKKGLLYRGHRVCWWWPQGGTALSAAEVGNNYKTVDDPSAYVAFPLVDEPDVALVVWTTTPWTLPSNAYAAVGAEVEYAVVDAGSRKLVVASALRESLATKLKIELPVLRTLKGRDLVGKRYVPPFDTYSKNLFDAKTELKAGGETAIYWRVIAADFVTLDSGTGVVHMAPAFGEDDFNAHKHELTNYVRPSEVPLLCAVKPDGRFVAEMGDLGGVWVKDADKPILKDLTARDLLVFSELYRHEYPYCWRADDDPLIQLARPAWYIRTTEKIGEAIANNRTVSWLPEHIKEGRFGDFLANNVDWALSRERYWGTPLNVWVCDADSEHEHAPSSVAEIEALNPRAFDHFHAAKKADPSLNDHLIVHKPWIDEVVFPCQHAGCNGSMRRVTEVIDAWFDSGSMPFAQWGYPHLPGSKENFERAFPADFISEAIDQTRGWFYSLLMVSTLVFDEATQERLGIAPERKFPLPYKTCVVLGHVCDRVGKKESKSKGNYTPPEVILERVRMEFAVVGPKPSCVSAVDGWVVIGREDREGLDLPEQVAGGQPPVVEVTGPKKTLRLKLREDKRRSRRVAVLGPNDAKELGVEIAAIELVKPADVPSLPNLNRVTIEDPTTPAPGADAFRWFFYASSPSWSNTRHSLTNVRMEQKEYLIKLRNVFSFFTIYANIDGFDPAKAAARPVGDRALLDRWLCSELGMATRDVRAALDGYRLYDAAGRLVALVDALSNWWLRKSRDRFWASKDDVSAQQDKNDAYVTLYDALVTIAKLTAPFTPFFAEELYQNLVRRPFADAPESVHLVGYPEADASVIDEALAREMAAVRELVSLGLQVRTANKLKVRQPLSRVDVVVSSADLRAAVASHSELIASELNVHEVRFLQPGEEGQAVRYALKPNFRALGPKLGKKVQLAKQALATLDAGSARAELATKGHILLSLGDESVELGPEEIEVAVQATEGFAAAGGAAGVVVLHIALTDELRDEGLAREILARVQAARKELGLDFVARIHLAIDGSERVRRVSAASEELFKSEALADALALGAPSFAAEVRELVVDGEELRLAIAAV